ncbi:MAG: hypothetical protein ACOCZE_12275 [Planctomycetota bacterium]
MIILAIAAIAVALVQLRRQEIAVQHEIQQLQVRRVALRREVAKREVRIGELTTPETLSRQWTRILRQRSQRPDETVVFRPDLLRAQIRPNQ